METQKTKQVEIELHNTTEQEKQSQALKSLRTNEVRWYFFLIKDCKSYICLFLHLSLYAVSLQEKYDRAVMKINQLKEQRDEQRDKIDAQSEEIDK